MGGQPDPGDLIAAVRAALKTDLVPHLPPDRLYAARMALNALGIAQRQIADDGARHRAAVALLRRFASGDTLDDLKRALAARIRSGDLTPDPALHAALVIIARTETEMSHPQARILAL